jgi:plastocyanin
VSRALVPLSLLLAAACDAGGGPPGGPPPTPIDPAVLGSVRGRVRFQGPVPAAAKLPMGGNPECAAHAGAVDGAVVVRDGGLANVLVSVKRGLEGRIFAVPDAPVVMANAKCVYTPRVVGVMTRQALKFVNEDPLDHNVHGFPEQGGFNSTLQGAGSAKVYRLLRPEAPFRVKCDLHPWMLGWVGVFNHPYFKVSGPDGAFELSGLPAGDYELEAWHERYGTRTLAVRVAAGAATAAEFTFTP